VDTQLRFCHSGGINSGIDPGVAVNRTARTLLDRLTRMEIPTEEFFQLANKLPDRELELLFELLRRRRMGTRVDEENGVRHR
jgi:hypothetical protein